jgi:hypothetical protein
MFNLVSDVRGVIGKADSWIETQWAQRIVQVCVVGALLFYVLSSEDLINTVDKAALNMVGLKLGKGGTRLLHALTFGIFLYICIRVLLDDLVKRFLGVVEGLVEGIEVEEEEE